MTKTDLDKHVKILGWLHLVMSCFFLLVGVVVVAFLLFGGILSNDPEALGIMTVVAVFVGGLLLVLGLPGIAAGFGLLKRKNWGRILAIIVGLLSIANFPLGTALGVYTTYILLQDTAPAYFE
jgi:hypothetical protein